jgi:NTE family protein
VIAGTSMGAIVGGLYASGMKADQIEEAFKKINWTNLFSTRVSREELSQRRKEQDFELSTALELGWRDGEFRAPQGAVSSRGLDALLRRYTLPAQEISDFNRLPIPSARWPPTWRPASRSSSTRATWPPPCAPA